VGDSIFPGESVLATALGDERVAESVARSQLGRAVARKPGIIMGGE